MTTSGDSEIALRLARVRELVAEAARDSARETPVSLIAVSKGQPVEALRSAYAAGQRDFGENYVQELVKKADALADLPDIRFHLIGHLQRNKVKYVAPRVAAVHSVDSPELAAELGRRVRVGELPALRRAFGDDARLPVLAEVNIAHEAQKAGASAETLEPLLLAIERAQSLHLMGLMCVPPLSDDPADSIPHFEALVRLRNGHGGQERLPELSMGMSGDYPEAIRCGATIVRVGTAIFGPRPPKTPVE